MDWPSKFGFWLERPLIALRIRLRQKHLKRLRDRMEREGMKELVPFLTEERIFGDKLEPLK